jgi:drug/metabolite transporter (DMT)-like permease
VANESWFVLAAVAPFLWSVCNHIDKHLLSKYFKGDEGVGTLMVVSALAAAVALPFLYLVDPAVLDVGKDNVAVIAVTSVLDVVTLWAYLKAMQGDSPSNVIIWYQTAPVLTILSGFIFLGETLSGTQGAAMGIILIGTTIVSIENAKGKLSFRWRTAAFMLLACSCWAAELAIFKVAALEENPWRSLFWKHVVIALLGVAMFTFLPKYRRSFITAMRENSVPILGLNLLNEVLFMGGTVLYGLASVLAPVALVMLTETFQSIFVFLIALALIRYLPEIATEEIGSRGAFWKKVGAIAITGAGTYLLLIST